jgi:hypothetical protein
MTTLLALVISAAIAAVIWPFIGSMADPWRVIVASVAGYGVVIFIIVCLLREIRLIGHEVDQ